MAPLRLSAALSAFFLSLCATAFAARAPDDRKVESHSFVPGIDGSPMLPEGVREPGMPDRLLADEDETPPANTSRMKPEDEYLEERRRFYDGSKTSVLQREYDELGRRALAGDDLTGKQIREWRMLEDILKDNRGGITDGSAWRFESIQPRTPSDDDCATMLSYTTGCTRL